MLTIILLCLGFVLGMGLIVLEFKVSDADGGFFAAGIFVLLLVLTLGITAFCDQYSKARGLPFRIAALQRTIAEQQALLSDDGKLVSGLEGLAVKEQLFENIKERNDLIARAEYIQISIWWFIKLPPNWREIAGLTPSKSQLEG